MPDTFGDVWRAVVLRCPGAGPLLAQQWVREAYTATCRKHPWSWLRSEGEIITRPANAGTVTVTRGSDVVVGVTLVFAATDVGRQFQTSGTPIYTVAAVNTLLNQATLDRPYGNASAVDLPARVLDAYVTLPPDFQRFLTVADPTNGWQLRWWGTEEELNQWDAQRTSTGTPCGLFTRRLATVPAALDGCVQYELWPYAISARNYPYYYIRHPEPLRDDSVFEGPLRSGGDTLLQGALAEAAEWPGTEDHKNPYYNLNLADRKRKLFHERVSELELRDEEIYLTWWETVSWINRGSWAPIDAKFMQSHDASYW